MQIVLILQPAPRHGMQRPVLNQMPADTQAAIDAAAPNIVCASPADQAWGLLHERKAQQATSHHPQQQAASAAPTYLFQGVTVSLQQTLEHEFLHVWWNLQGTLNLCMHASSTRHRSSGWHHADKPVEHWH